MKWNFFACEAQDEKSQRVLILTYKIRSLFSCLPKLLTFIYQVNQQ